MASGNAEAARATTGACRRLYAASQAGEGWGYQAKGVTDQAYPGANSEAGATGIPRATRKEFLVALKTRIPEQEL